MSVNTKINIPIYNASFYLAQADTLEEIIEQYDLPKSPEGWDADAFCADHGDILLLGFKNECTLDVVVHELVHLVNVLSNKRYIHFDTVCDEPQAYLMQWLFNEVANNLIINSYYEQN